MFKKAYQMATRFLVLMSVALATAACVPAAIAPSVTDATPSQSAVAGVGSYAGVLPCADCSGIETKLTLKQDGSFTMIELYQGTDTKPFVTNGTYTLDKSGSVITLMEKGAKGAHRTYKLGKSQIVALNIDGVATTGPLAANYVLTKTK